MGVSAGEVAGTIGEMQGEGQGCRNKRQFESRASLGELKRQDHLNLGFSDLFFFLRLHCNYYIVENVGNMDESPYFKRKILSVTTINIVKNTYTMSKCFSRDF